jgi:putative ABC transport system substrate-binding protein
MRKSFERLALGLTLIGAVSAVLLVSDWRSRSAARGLPRVAVFQFASRPLMEEAVNGAIAGLAARGFRDGETVRLQRFNSENDLPTANSMAKAILDARFDMVVTVSTPCLQVMATANREGKMLHVFGAVTDPAASGVGIGRSPLDHPRHLAGVGTFQPVREAFLLARQMYPALRVVGLVRNPAEACAEACAAVARQVGRELGISLLEATVENSAGVLEASNSLVARGAEVLVIGCDNTVEMSMTSVVRAANQGRIPVIGLAPGHVTVGALAGLGADYYEVGRVIGGLAGDILSGRDPRTVRIENVLPKTLTLNLSVPPTLRDPWRIPPETLKTAAWIVDQQGHRVPRK